mgnify:CR=1 FL=1
MGKSFLVTTSLPYANGPLHLGHLLENVQADIWVRFQRAQGRHCVFLSGSDVHGTATMMAAEKRGMTPLEWVTTVSEGHRCDLQDFGISLDTFHSTRAEINAQLVKLIYMRLESRGCIAKRTIDQLFDVEKGMFLPDRYVRGDCPRCGAKDQYGDNCEVCSATYAAVELKNPYSAYSRTKPEMRASEHVFFRLGLCQDILQLWLDQASLQAPVRNKLQEWFQAGLRDWDISRDAPYFGYLIPGYVDKYFYVWLDAPIGYLAALQRYGQGDDYIAQVFGGGHLSNWDVHHFIGKDILYFHGLFWPALLYQAGYNLPSSLHAHGFLSIDGQKMSKSRGTFITIRDCLAHLPPDVVRYYFASKLNDGIGDIDFSWQDCARRTNADLVGKIVNLGSRCSGILQKHFQGALATALHDERLWQHFVDAQVGISAAYEAKQFSHVVRIIIGLADDANRYIDQHKPWQAVKLAPSTDVQKVVTMGLVLFRLLVLYLQPIIPTTAARVAQMFAEDDLDWAHYAKPSLNVVLAPFPRLVERLDEKNNPFSGGVHG